MLVRLHVGVECGAGISGEDVGVEPGVECKVGLFVNRVWANGFGRQMGQIDGYDVIGVAGLECSFAVFIEDVIRGGNEVGEILGQAVGIADGSERANVGHRWEKNKPTVRRIKHTGGLFIAAPKLAGVERSCTRGQHEPDVVWSVAILSVTAMDIVPIRAILSLTTGKKATLPNVHRGMAQSGWVQRGDLRHRQVAAHYPFSP